MAKGLATSFVTVIVAVALFWLSSGPGVEAVSDKLLKIACSDMTPRHPGFKPENANHVPCPYRLLVDKIPIVPGELVNLTLTSVNKATPFKGFMIQARDAEDNVVGTFLPVCENHGRNRSHHMISCTNGIEPYNAVVQSNNKFKYKETFTWVAPVSLKDFVRFKYTIVHDFERYWTNEETDDIPVAPLLDNDYKIKSSINHEYYIYKLYIQNCFS